MKGNLIISKNFSFYHINNNLIKVNVNGNNNKIVNPYKIIDLYILGNKNTLEVIGKGKIIHIKIFGNDNIIHFKNNFQPQYNDLGIGNKLIKSLPEFLPLPTDRIVFRPYPLYQNQMNQLTLGNSNIDGRVNDFLNKLKESIFSEIPFSLRQNSKECFFCQKPFIENDIVEIFSCNKHIFHKECLKDWIKTNIDSPKCPKCDQLSLNLSACPFIPLFPRNQINHIPFLRHPIIPRPLTQEINNINDNGNNSDELEFFSNLNDDNEEDDDDDDDGLFTNFERGVSSNILNNLVVSKIKNIDKLDNDKKKCTICLENYANGDDSIALPCIHIFHALCIKTWLKNHNNCPICKYKVNFDTFEDDDIDDIY